MLILHAPIDDLLKHWQQQGILTALDRHFAIEMSAMQPQASPLFKVICALLSQRLSNQHTCLVIDAIDFNNPLGEETYSMAQQSHVEPSCQISATAQQLMAAIAEFDAVGHPGDNTPLIIEFGRLYLNKYHFFETQVANTLMQLATKEVNVDNRHTAEYLTALFPQQLNHSAPSPRKLDWQKIATATALNKALAVITGGPGTGKTTTVTKLLLLLLSQQSFTIKLVAPTGKAAARLSESIKASKARLLTQLHTIDNESTPVALIEALRAVPEEASTLHRLLGVIPHSHQFRHSSANPLRLDVLVVDEASMVDLPMMYKLLSALPSHARCILLGDQDQLASVEAGAVLADICAGLKASPTDSDPWQMRYSAAQAKLIEQLTNEPVSQFISKESAQHFGDSLCMLRHSHRFVGDAGIGLLANAVNQANVAQIRHVWQQNHQELQWFEHQINHQEVNVGKQQLLEQSVAAYQPYLEMIKTNQQQPTYSAQAIIECFNQYRLLCAMRSGEFGVDGINASMTLSLQTANLISPDHEFYLGRPIIIQNNDYNIGLFNGDIGLILQDPTQANKLMAHFIQADGSLLKVLPARLPNHDTCFAMTVHKSQGSEFNCVSFVLPMKPTTSQWQLLTKELVYTAITRAKAQFNCLGTARVFERASKQVTMRSSGLGLRLWHKQEIPQQG